MLRYATSVILYHITLLYMYIYIYTHVYIYIYTCIYIYIYIHMHKMFDICSFTINMLHSTHYLLYLVYYIFCLCSSNNSCRSAVAGRLQIECKGCVWDVDDWDATTVAKNGLGFKRLLKIRGR